MKITVSVPGVADKDLDACGCCELTPESDSEITYTPKPVAPAYTPADAPRGIDARGLVNETTAVDATGAARSAADRALAESSGFSPAQPLFTAGTRVVQVGVDNAKQKRAEWEAMPETRAACAELITRVQAEKRDDVGVDLGKLRMAESGALVLPSGNRYVLNMRGFSALVTKLGCGGAEYLRDACTPKLRAINVNHQAQQIELREGSKARMDRTRIMLRTRQITDSDGRQVFAVVSPTYTAHDVDSIAAQVARGVPAGMKGSIAYDAERGRYRIEALSHSTVAPEDYVAGEYFRAGVVVSGDDTGGGSIKVSAVVWQNLCLNLIILDESTIETGRFVHKGSQRGIAAGVAQAIADASASLSGFLNKWNDATHEPVVTESQIAMGRQIAAMGVFRGLLDREMVKIPGRTEEICKGLTAALYDDRSSAVRTLNNQISRAAVVNALTQYAHTDVGDPWLSDSISKAAGRILASNKPLPFVADAA